MVNLFFHEPLDALRRHIYSSIPDRVQQIISKLPLFNNGQLQTLMREPVLHDKRLEHAKFCKYATELLERVTGERQPDRKPSLFVWCL